MCAMFCSGEKVSSVYMDHCTSVPHLSPICPRRRHNDGNVPVSSKIQTRQLTLTVISRKCTTFSSSSGDCFLFSK